MTTLEIMNPVAKRTGGEVAPAPRLDTLAGKTIGIYWNTKVGGDVALQRVAEIIQNDYPEVRFNNYVHHPPVPSDMIDEMLSQCDAVIGSTGD
jgi:hypothetical protein